MYLFNKVKAYINDKVCTQIFIGALFLREKTWKLYKCASTTECILVYLYDRMFYSNKMERTVDKHNNMDE